MNVVAINGSPKKDGNTGIILKNIAQELAKESIQTHIIHIGNKTIRGCFGCGGCYKNLDDRCVAKDDEIVNETIEKMKEADGIILGAPVHFAGIPGTMKAFLDRAFYVAGANKLFRHKVGASIVAVRRAGGVTTFDQLNHFIHYAEMVVPTSNYWNVVHGRLPGEVNEDHEGLQTARVLAKNMAWTLKMMQIAKEQGMLPPERETKIMTNFVR